MALGIGAIIITGMFSFRAAQKALLQRTYDQLTSIRLTRKSTVERFLNDRLRETAFMAQQGEGGWLPVSGYYSGSMVIDENWFSQPVPKHNDGAFIVDYRKADSVKRLLAVCRIRNDNKYLALIIKPGLIDSMMLEISPKHGLGYSGETYFVGTDYLMRTSSRFIEGSEMSTRVITIPVLKALEGREGSVLASDYRGIKVLSSYGRMNVNGLNWIILAELDYSEATASINAIRNNIILMSLITALALFLLTYTISRTITLPLKKLKKAASALADGKLHEPLMVESDDEIGELTEAFNNMIVSLGQKDKALRVERSKSVKSAIDGQDRERQRLSRELHDGIGQGIIGIRLRLAALENLVPSDLKEKVGSVISINDTLIDEVRATSNALMPPALAEFGLLSAVKSIGCNITDTTGIKVTVEGELPDGIFGRKPVLYIFRVIQEALNNAAKHSDATEIKVAIQTTRDLLKLEIADNGKGFEAGCINTGLGLPNLKERVSLLKGCISIISSPGNGTVIRASIPVNKVQYDKIIPC